MTTVIKQTNIVINKTINTIVVFDTNVQNVNPNNIVIDIKDINIDTVEPRFFENKEFMVP